jgi:hypothetical protein
LLALSGHSLVRRCHLWANLEEQEARTAGLSSQGILELADLGKPTARRICGRVSARTRTRCDRGEKPFLGSLRPDHLSLGYRGGLRFMLACDAAGIPDHTPSGRPIARGPVVTTIRECLAVVESGEAVVIVGARAEHHYSNPRIRFIEIGVPPRRHRSRETPSGSAACDTRPRRMRTRPGGWVARYRRALRCAAVVQEISLVSLW